MSDAQLAAVAEDLQEILARLAVIEATLRRLEDMLQRVAGKP